MGNGETLRRSSSTNAFESPTFGKDGSFHVDEAVGSASISPSGRDVVLASRQGLHIIDLDNPYSPPRHLIHRTPWEVADVQWSPFPSRDYWVVSTSNQKALVWNLELCSKQSPVEHVLHSHSRAITDINFSAHDPDLLATCAVDSFVHCWDLRSPARPSMTFADWFSGATQVKWNRQNQHLIASSHDKCLHIWDTRRGAYPLRTLEAHTTKIYGIDWSRVRSTDILTCSLDMTIKFWNYTEPNDIPKHVIKTPYPVWRARHTPFGCGVLAMPQRNNHELHLYDIREQADESSCQIDEPIHSFFGHHNQVKEFLWRAQGDIQDEIDNRAFQLVSWSTDRNLLLHRLDDSVLEKVGHRRGASRIQMNVTRQGATYKTFHTDPELAKAPTSLGKASQQGLSTIFKGSEKTGMKKIPIPLLGWGSYERGTLHPGSHISAAEKRKVSPIAWMKGVKISKSEEYSSFRRDGFQRIPSGGFAWDSKESLGDEVTFVGEKYKKVTFEKINVHGRSLEFSLNGPWGSDEALVHIRVTVDFPKDYPEVSPGDCKIEKTSSIPDSSFIKMTYALKAIGEAFSAIGQGSLEAIVCFLLGERSLEETLAWASDPNEVLDAGNSRTLDDSSSDEGGDFSGAISGLPIQDLESSGNDLLTAINANANVPLPKACGACWAKDDRLICFFPSKANLAATVSMFRNTDYDNKTEPMSDFESFGRLHNSGPNAKPKHRQLSNSSDSEASDSSLSSSNTSHSSEITNKLPLRYRPFAALRSNPERARSMRSVDRSQHSGAFTLQSIKNLESETFISIQNVEDILPAKRSLAESYIIHGDGPSVCRHNSEAASKLGYQDLADIWTLVGQILCDQVPLEVVSRAGQSETDILVLAKRSLVRIQRRDSGLDLAFDDPDSVVNSRIKGSVKWGNHPLGNSWLIELLLEYFESIADIQMLTMLSCVLSEHLVRNNEMLHKSVYSRPKTLNTPRGTFPLPIDYYPSLDVGWSIVHASSMNDPKKGHSVQYPALSYPSSFTGQDSSDNTEAGNTPSFSAGHTPPLISQQGSRSSPLASSFSSSPEQMKRSNSLISNTLAASLTKPFSFIGSASPPAPLKDQELSTSAPSSAPIGTATPWAKPRSNDKSMNVRWTEQNSSAIDDSDSPVVESTYVETQNREVIVSIKNQEMFDDEACSTVPLLNSAQQARLQVFREAYSQLLYAWSLPIVRCEVLKFNHPWTGVVPDVQPSPSESMLTLGRRSEQPQMSHIPSNTGLSVALHCNTCGECLDPSVLGSSVCCNECQHKQSTLPCSICFEAINGLYKSCLECGHVSHFDCLDQWLLEAAEEEELQCEAGCGCICSEHTNFELDSDDGSEGVDEDELQQMVRSHLNFGFVTSFQDDDMGTVRRIRATDEAYRWY